MSFRLNFNSVEDYVSGHLRNFIFAVGGLVLFVGIIAVSVFLSQSRARKRPWFPTWSAKN
uniref:Uncharacterized protein n=1 Tax=uncultured bacterium contig00147 TaxID=1181587 RepID=A0A806KNF5_9BACT|nr:hypothetical protein [uncultured bacterium contig00147]